MYRMTQETTKVMIWNGLTAYVFSPQTNYKWVAKQFNFADTDDNDEEWPTKWAQSV